MTLTATDVITPLGRIDLAVIWPGVNEDTARGYVGEYLSQGYSQAGASQDDAAKAWAEYRAFDQLYLRLTGRPSSATVQDEGSMSYTQSQIDNWRILADEALAEYEDLIPGDAAGSYGVITSLR